MVEGPRYMRSPRSGRVLTMFWPLIVILAVALLVVVAVPAWFSATQSLQGSGISTASPTPAQSESDSVSESPLPESSSTPSASSVPTTPGPSSTASPPTDASAKTALTELEAIPSTNRSPVAPYDRDLFGQAWADVDRNGCDTRNDILGRDLLNPTFKAGTGDCKVLSGTLIDPYDGRSVEFVSGWETSMLVPVDHIVALSWAWKNGADIWTDEERTKFANEPLNLAASSQDMNQEKSDSGPGDWLPPVPELRCVYVVNWVDVVVDYRLTIDSTDRSAAEAVLRGC